MKRIGLVLSMLIGLFLTQTSFACPRNCVCDSKGQVIYNYNTNYNTTDNSVKASVGNVSATGGSSKSDSSSTSSATGGAGGSVVNSGNFNGTVAGGSIAKGAVENNVKGGDSNATGISGGSFGGSSSATVEKGAVENNVAGGTAAASADNSGNNNGTATVTVEGDTYQARRIPVATAYAASLTSGADTCLGSASGGVQLPVIGVSLGKTTRDDGCKLIKETHLLREFGTTEFEQAACYRARAGKEGKEIDAAMESAGIKCNKLVVTTTTVTDPDIDLKIDRAFRKAVAK
jgi:hypothetical protein